MFQSDSGSQAKTARTSPLSNASSSSQIGRGSEGLEKNQSVISEAIKITGDVSSRDQLVVHGNITGDMDCASLIVGENGQISGNVLADEVIIHGQVEGSIRGVSVSLHKTANVSGDIYHQNIAIEMGTIFDGSLRRSENPKAESDGSSSSASSSSSSSNYSSGYGLSSSSSSSDS
ncbi:MAG: bactofilin family protein [Methyloligellaceae bacterium]